MSRPLPARLGVYQLQPGDSSTGPIHHARGLDPHLGREGLLRLVDVVGHSEVELQPWLAAVRARSALEHPAIPPVLAAGVAEGWLWWALRPPVGTPLDVVLRDRELEGAQLLAALEQVARALEVAHRQGVSHGGVGPTAVRIGELGAVELTGWRLGLGGTPTDPKADVDALVELILASGGVAAASPLLSDLVGSRSADPGGTLSANALADALADALDGHRRRREALALVAEARSVFAEARAQAERAESARSQAELALAALGPLASAADKGEAWRLEEVADEALAAAGLAGVEGARRAHAALALLPDLADAHGILADHLQDRHRRAERAGAGADARLLEQRLRRHAQPRHRAYLRGVGALTLLTDPPGASVEVHRYVRRSRRLVLQRVRLPAPLKTPLNALELPIGSYLLLVQAPGRPTVRYPVEIIRDEHWDGVPPGEISPLPVPLPREEAWTGGVAYIPAGWCRLGGDPLATGSLPAERRWLGGFMLQQTHITTAQWCAYLKELDAERGRAAATAEIPRASAGTAPVPWFSWSDDGELLREDGSGSWWCMEGPVTALSCSSIERYAAHQTRRDSLAWRLPREAEWEKAARGVDGRLFPWGDDFDPSRARMWVRGTSAAGLAPVGSHPLDESPYGVRDLAGNAATRCAPEGSEELGPVRGGSYFFVARRVRLAVRELSTRDRRVSWVGARLARSITAADV